MTEMLETPARLEPCLLERVTTEFTSTAVEVSRHSERLGSKLAPETAANLADMVRTMNCYYSNLIEGHNTRPKEIEAALANELAKNPEKRNLQLEAVAHIRVQAAIDHMYAEGALPEPASVDFIRWIHREFYRGAPEALLWVGEGQRRFKLVPGEFRARPEHDVAVGRHVPPSSHRILDFMRYFEERYRLVGLASGEQLLLLAAAHHRLNYIHPFPDGNGRVSRLMSHAMVLHAGAGAHGLWSIARGLARGLKDRGEYTRMMDYADSERMGPLDGRGNLSLRALEELTLWFLRTAEDQIKFMTSLFDLDGLALRLSQYVTVTLELRHEAALLATDVLRRGSLPRGEAARVTGLSERTAREILASLIQKGILHSTSPKAPVSLRFPADSYDVLFPRLYAPAS